MVTTSAMSAMGITDAQLAEFEKDGFLCISEFLPATATSTLVQELSGAVDEGANLALLQGRLRKSHFDQSCALPFPQRLVALCNATGEPPNHYPQLIAKAMSKNHKTEAMFNLLTHPQVLDAVESLIGGEILCHPQWNIRASLPGDRGAVMHQDINLLHPSCEATPMVNLWIPLVDTDEYTGCLRVARGSHRGGILPYTATDGIPASTLRGFDVVSCPTSARGAVIFTQLLAHGSFDHNASADFARWSMDIRYSVLGMPTGRDEVPGFVARSRKAPGRVTTSAAQWRALVNAVPGAANVANGVAAQDLTRASPTL